MPRVSDSNQLPTSSLLSALDLGPAWARPSSGSQGRNAPRPPANPADTESSPRESSRDHNRDHNRNSSRDSQHGQNRGDRRDSNRSQSRDPRDNRQSGAPRDDRRRNDRRDNRQDGRNQRDSRDSHRDGPPRFQQEYVEPAPGVRVLIQPNPSAVQLVAKEIHHVARVYSLFDVANILLARRDRCLATFESAASRPPLYRCKFDDSLWLTREEAIAHFWQAPWRAEFYSEETEEITPPSGNFQVVARCGLSGEWLGPPNFHTYQTTLRHLHRERFPHMRFEAYAAKVRTERGEEAVQAWLETMKSRTVWKTKSHTEPPITPEAPAAPEPAPETTDTTEPIEAEAITAESEATQSEAPETTAIENTHDETTTHEAAIVESETQEPTTSQSPATTTHPAEPTITFADRSAVERDFAQNHFDKAYAEVRHTDVSADIPAKHLSPALLTSLRGAGTHAKQHPAILIPAICRMLESTHLPVFKREGRLFTGPARPRSLSPDTALAERPAAIVAWLASTPKPTLKGLWKDVLPDGQSEPCKDWLADLFWLLTEGFVLLFADDRISLQHRRDGKPAAPTTKEPQPKTSAAKPEKSPKAKPKRKRRAKKRRRIPPPPAILHKLRSLGFTPRQVLTVGRAKPHLHLRLAKRLLRNQDPEADTE